MTDRHHRDAGLDADVVPGHIAVRGAQENNLRDLDIDMGVRNEWVTTDR